MGGYNAFELSKFQWEVLKLYIKYGLGMAKLYDTTFFINNLSDETACLTLNEFAEKAVNNEDFLWSYIDKLHEDDEDWK